MEVLRNDRATALNNYTLCLNKKNEDIRTLDVKFDVLHKTNIDLIEENVKKAKQCRQNENRDCILKVLILLLLIIFLLLLLTFFL